MPTDPLLGPNARVEHLARAIIAGDAQFGDFGLFEIVEEYDGDQKVGQEAILVEDHLIALAAYDRAVEILRRRS